MSDILLQRIADGEISFQKLKQWLLTQENEIDFTCSQNEFLTYFLNFIHEDINNRKKFGEVPLKFTPKKIKPCREETHIERKSSRSLNMSALSPSPQAIYGRSFTEADTSTPKVSKLQSHSELNSSYYSPVSPLYREKKANTPKSICLGDFLVKKSTTKKKVLLQNVTSEDSSRRITPTSLNHTKTSDSFKSANCFDNFNTKEVSANSLNQNRMFLAKERLKIISRKNSDDGSLALNSKKLSVSETKEEIEAQLSLVTYRNQLNMLADVYILILKHNFVLNITGEIYFLISLLITKQYVLDSTDESQMGVDFLSQEDKNDFYVKCKIIGCSDYFESIHNIVYFAVRCLETQCDVLKYYDKLSLKLFSENKRIKEFSPTFSETLGKISDKKIDRFVQVSAETANVCYNLETDTKNNFVSEISFLSFRKQRDLFYEILRIWEQNHLLPGWCFQVGLTGKIKTLLALQNEPGNFVYFARLFKDQLITSCGKSPSSSENENYSLPSSFPSVDPSKLNRLKNRLTTKQVPSSLNDLPHFIGNQEFYKEFISAASNHFFNVHLSNVFITEILELNGNSLSLGGIGESDVSVDAAMRESFAIKLRNLRILAKFLGFIESIPYKSDANNYQENALKHLIKIRKKKIPPLDIKEILLSSVKNNHVVLTVPWLVKYISMLDYVTLRLPYYISVYEILFQIYHSYEKLTKNFNYNASLVKFTLGWLFDLPHFPDTEYTQFCSNQNKHFVRKPHTLDDLAIVDQSILYSCCPYLEEIKKMLTCSSECHNVTVKHITPVTAVESSEQISKRRLEQQLEEAFFNGHPDSMRKTVEFVSERIASACVKHICTFIVPPYKKDALIEIKTFLETQVREMQELSPNKEKKSQMINLRNKSTHLCQEKLHSLRAKCENELRTILSDRVSKSIDSLLALDTLPQTRTTCIAIGSRMCRERIKQWINAHLTANIFMKDVDKELQKLLNNDSRKAKDDKLVFALPSCGRNKNHIEDSLGGFDLAEKIRILSVDFLENPEIFNQKDILYILNEAKKSIDHRSDLNDVIISYLLNLLLNLSILIVMNRPDLMNCDDLAKRFVNIWRCYCPSIDDLFKDLLCPRNVAVLNGASNSKKVWKDFARFVSFLIKEKVLSCDNFESQCSAFFRADLDQDTLENVCYFMKNVVGNYKKNHGDYNKFTMLMEFLSEFCKDL